MVSENLPKEFLARLKAVTAKRAGIVIAHILKHGHITTEWSCRFATPAKQ